MAKKTAAAKPPAKKLKITLLRSPIGFNKTQGKTVDELAEAALRKGLEEQNWQDLLAYGRETGRASGYTEEDVPRALVQVQAELAFGEVKLEHRVAWG